MQECGECSSIWSCTDFYGRDACPSCEKAKVNEKRKQLDLDMARIEAILAELVLAREQDNTEIHKISADNRAMTEVTSQHRGKIDTIVEQLEYLNTMMSRLTKSVVTMLEKNVKEE